MKTLLAIFFSEASIALAVMLILVGYCAACVVAVLKGQP